MKKAAIRIAMRATETRAHLSGLQIVAGGWRPGAIGPTGLKHDIGIRVAQAIPALRTMSPATNVAWRRMVTWPVLKTLRTYERSKKS
jgi:hypothetical protein